LANLHNEDISKQKNILEMTIEKWMGDYPQLDDMVIIGMQV
jgi:hypothetical protein